MSNDVEGLFMGLLAIYVSSLIKHWFKPFACFFEFGCFLIIEF